MAWPGTVRVESAAVGGVWLLSPIDNNCPDSSLTGVLLLFGPQKSVMQRYCRSEPAHDGFLGRFKFLLCVCSRMKITFAACKVGLSPSTCVMPCHGRIEAMVIDEQVMPLQRIWCLFEVYHTILLSQKRNNFQGGGVCSTPWSIAAMIWKLAAVSSWRTTPGMGIG